VKIETEWKALRRELSDEQAKDGRRAFYAGALMILDLWARGKLNKGLAAGMTEEVDRVLHYRDESEAPK
jgi:hypothetical protein